MRRKAIFALIDEWLCIAICIKTLICQAYILEMLIYQRLHESPGITCFHQCHLHILITLAYCENVIIPTFVEKIIKV